MKQTSQIPNILLSVKEGGGRETNECLVEGTPSPSVSALRWCDCLLPQAD